MEHERLIKELHKPAKRNYTCRSFDMPGLDETWYADLIEMIPYARDNKGYRYLFTIIEIFPKYAWAVPVKRKICKDVSDAMKSVLVKGGDRKISILTDAKNFITQIFKNL